MLTSLVRGGAAALLLVAPAAAQTDFSGVLQRVNLPPGFKISVFGEMPRPREIEVAEPGGEIFIGSRHGHIYSMIDSNRDGVADEVRERANGLNVPNGVAVHDGMLYVAMQDRIAYWPDPVGADTTAPIAPLLTVNDKLHDASHHGWRYVGFGPDGKLYVALGAPCNICDLTDNTGKIVRMNPDGSNWEVVADGVRNSVGFDWNPITGELWFTDNGADRMGDDIPPDELNRVTRVGQNFGFPYFGGASVKLTGYENAESPVEWTPPEIEFQAHTANLGIEFYDGDMFPAEYKNDAFVAQHGSWNRTVPVGYRIMRIRFDDEGNAVGKEVFADGWLTDGGAVGRPVDIEELPDGSLLVSDDFASVIYRISYGE
jgi:glucose/arabinose dehydrogenase